MNENLLEGEGYALSEHTIPHIIQYNRMVSGVASTGVRAVKQTASIPARDFSGNASGIIRSASERNALHADQPRSAAEAESKPTRSGPEHAPNQSRSGVEGHSKGSRSALEQPSKKNFKFYSPLFILKGVHRTFATFGALQKFHVCSLLRRPQPLPWRGLAIGVFALLFMAICMPAWAQQEKVSGSVVSATDGNALKGVTVTVKNTATRTMTDSEGRYQINAGTDAILVFTSIGYQMTEEAIRGRGEVNAFLEPAASALQEVDINAGYYTTNRKTSTGNIARVDERVIARQPVSNPMLALQGRVPGLEISQVNGIPGSNVRILIRGQNSIDNGNEPLYIVDGVPWLSASMTQVAGAAGAQSPFNSINPADISSIEVLKDADATAIYGSRGSNGVILISTKRGGGKRKGIDVNFQTGFGQITRTMELMDTRRYIQMRKEAMHNQDIQPTAVNAPDLMLHDTTRYTDWKELLIGNTAKLTNLQLAFNGGNERTYFRIGGGYRRETTVFPGDMGNTRGSAQLNLGHRSSDGRLQLNVTGNFSSDLNDLVFADRTGQIYAQPNIAIYQPDGSLAWSENGSPNYNNPLGALKQSYDSKTNNLIANVTANYQIVDGLNVKVNAGYTTLALSETAILPNESYQPLASRTSGNSRFSHRNFYSWIVEPQVSFNRQWRRHRVAALVGASWQQEENGGKSIRAQDFSSEALLHTPTGAATLSITENFYQYRYQSLFGRINYQYDGTYLVNVTLRRDGSSRFGPNRRYANFGALGVGWVFSGMDALKEHLPLLSFGKLRASYGITGNDKIGDYQYMDTYGTVRYPYDDQMGLAPERLFNPDYGWETNRKLESALELGFWQNRLLLSASWFRNRSGNQLINYTLPTQTGFSGIIRNLPALVENKGWELELNAIPIQSAKWQWNSALNWTRVSNKLLEFPDLENSSYASQFELGESLNIVKVYDYLGVDPASGIWQVDLERGRSTIVDLTPDFYGGWDNTVSYANIQLSVFLQFVKKTAPNYIRTLPAPAGIRGYNQPEALLGRWQQAGDRTDIQRFATTGEELLAWSLYYVNSTGAYTDASFIRLKNVELAYTFPAFNVGRTAVNNLRLYAQGQNLATFTNYLGNDPEVNTMQALPPIRMFAFGLQVTL